MAHKRTDCRASRICADQQRPNRGGARVPPDQHSIAATKAPAVAGNAHRAVAANCSWSAFGEAVKHRILVVEDNQPNRELLCDWLESQGFEVVYAENLQQSYAAF